MHNESGQLKRNEQGNCFNPLQRHGKTLILEGNILVAVTYNNKNRIQEIKKI